MIYINETEVPLYYCEYTKYIMPPLALFISKIIEWKDSTSINDLFEDDIINLTRVPVRKLIRK